MYTTEYSQLTLGVSTRPSGARHDPRQNSSNHRLKAGWKPKSSMSCWRLSLYLPFAKSKETLTSAWAVKRSEIGNLGGRSAHAREAVAACPASGPHPWSAHARQACAEEARGAELSCPLLYPKRRASRGAAPRDSPWRPFFFTLGSELRHSQGATLTFLMCLGLLVLCLEWPDELIEVVAKRLLRLGNLSEVPLPVVHHVHLEQWRVRLVRRLAGARRTTETGAAWASHSCGASEEI